MNAQTTLFERIADPFGFRALFDHMPNVFLFVKNLDSRLVAANVAVLERLGVQSEAEIVGTNDDEYFPAAIASGFREDYEQVFATGQPILNRLEVWYDE